jgi:protein-tyrosine-phosphatase
MAEALTKRQYGEQVLVKSVGLKLGTPEDTTNAMEALQIHFDINPSRHISRGIHGLNFQGFDLVVAMDK